MSSPTICIVNAETILPHIPPSIGVTNPTNASTILPSRTPPDFFPKVPVLVCGGTVQVVDSVIQATNVSSQVPATSPCSHTTLTGASEGIARGREVVSMLRVEDRPMPESV